MPKKVSLIVIVFLLLVGSIVSGCNRKEAQQAQENTPLFEMAKQNNSHVSIAQPIVSEESSKELPNLNNITNTKYPDIVAIVGDSKISGLELTREILIKQYSYKSQNKPQSDSFYEEVSLGLLVKNALIDNEVKIKRMTVSTEDAKSYLEQQKQTMDSLSDSDSAQMAYNKTITENGFSNASDYVNSPGAISATQTFLGRERLRNFVQKTISKDQNTAHNAWEDYTDQLINNDGNYKVLIPVEIKGFQQLEDKVSLNKDS